MLHGVSMLLSCNAFAHLQLVMDELSQGQISAQMGLGVNLHFLPDSFLSEVLWLAHTVR